MRVLLLFHLLLILFSCGRFFATSAQEAGGDESVDELVLDYVKWSSTEYTSRIAGSIHSKSEKKIYDVRIKISILSRTTGLVSKDYFSVRQINPYENYTFEKKVTAAKGDEITLQIQSSHY